MAFVVAVRGDRRSRSTDERAAPPADSQDRSTRSPDARYGTARSALLEKTKENEMRAIFVAPLVSVGIVLLGVSPGSAAPGLGGALETAANLNREVDQAHRRGYHYRHCRWRHPCHPRWRENRRRAGPI